MSVSDSILPSNLASLERALEAYVGGRIDALPDPVRTLYTPELCPMAALPHLAWAWGVDEWDANWSEATKRAVIKASFGVKRVKGTVAAVKRALAAHGYSAELVEWFNSGRPAFTFRVIADMGGKPMLTWPGEHIVNVVDDAKNARSVLEAVEVTNSAGGPFYLSAFPEYLLENEVLPNPPIYPEQAAVAYFGASVNFLFDITVNP